MDVYLCEISILQTGGAIEHRNTGDMENGHEGVLRVTRKIIRFRDNNTNNEKIIERNLIRQISIVGKRLG